MKIYNVYQSGKRLYIDEKENPDNKIVCNKFESEQTTLRLISDGTLPPRLYWALRNPKLSQKYFILPLVNDNELIVGTDISATPGLWDLILIGTPDDYIIEGTDIDQSRLTYVSDTFSRLFVRDNYLKELDFEEQCSPTFKVFYDEIMFQLSKKANEEDIPTKVSELENDSKYITEDDIEDLIDLPISKTEENGVVIFDVNEAENEYALATGKNTKSLGQGAFTGGVYNQAGSMAFTIINVDTTAKTYTLDSTEGLEVGDVYSAHVLYDDNTSSQGENYGQITAINGNVVTVDRLFCEKTFTTSANYLDRNSLETERNTFRIIKKPNVGTRKLGYGATAFGGGNKSLLKGAFSAGQYNEVYGSNGIGLGNGNKVGYNGYGEGYHTYCIGFWSHTEGKFVIALGQFDHVEGLGDTELPDNITIHSSIKEIIEEWAINKFHLTKGDIVHLEGYNSLALADMCHNEGKDTISLGFCDHVEGCNVVTYGAYAHGQGYSPVNACIELDIFSMTKEEIMNEWLSRSNKKKFALGYGKASDISGEACLALDDYSSARNYQCLARFVADASGWSTRALGDASHTQGRDTEARKAYSDASGLGTIANAECQHTGGKYNEIDEEGKYLEIIGNGTSNSKRSNARTLDKDGNAWFAGDVKAGNASLKDAYKHAVTNKGKAFAEGMYKFKTNSEGHVTGVTAVKRADIERFGFIRGYGSPIIVDYGSFIFDDYDLYDEFMNINRKILVRVVNKFESGLYTSNGELIKTMQELEDEGIINSFLFSGEFYSSNTDLSEYGENTVLVFTEYMCYVENLSTINDSIQIVFLSNYSFNSPSIISSSQTIYLNTENLPSISGATFKYLSDFTDFEIDTTETEELISLSAMRGSKFIFSRYDTDSALIVTLDGDVWSKKKIDFQSVQTSVLLKDTSTSKQYQLEIQDGKLTMTEVTA